MNVERMAMFKANQTIFEASIVRLGSPAEKVTKLIEDRTFTNMRTGIKIIKETAQKLIIFH